jgi:hypothetical protein
MRKLVLMTALALASSIAIAPTAKAGELEAQSYALEHLGQSKVESDFDLASITIAKEVVSKTPGLALAYAESYCQLERLGYNVTEASSYIHGKIKIALADQTSLVIAAGIRVATSSFIYAIEKQCNGM